jgi:hypothetical protein
MKGFQGIGLITLFIIHGLWAQTPRTNDSVVIRNIYDEALLRGKSYELLEGLCKAAPKRLSGSPGAAAAVEWGYQAFKSIGVDSVWLQETIVPRWERGKIEYAKIVTRHTGGQELSVCALGGSVPTAKDGITHSVIEVHNWEELAQLGKAKIQGKIVFFNRPMDASQIYTFAAYGGCVNQRVQGAAQAAQYGAVAVIIRSMTLASDDHPHTGSVIYSDTLPRIPAAAISTLDADYLSSLLKLEPDLSFHLQMNCRTLEEVTSYNVIGELRGTERPEEIILVGGHLDAWDKGEGAHDDGAGCAHSIEALRILKQMGFKPKQTVRAVLFMNEENGLRGAHTYAEEAERKKETHLLGIESDRGGFSPRGFNIEAGKDTLDRLEAWINLLTPYGLHYWEKGGSGADISPLRGKALLMGMVPDSQRYFDFHHADTDVFSSVHKRELELGAAAMASVIYLFSTQGIPAYEK